MAKRTSVFSMNRPIPGENYTSNTKNYPWHRPPDVTDPNQAMELIIKQLMTPKKAFGLLNMLSMGMSVATATDILLTSGVAAGKWTIDTAIFLAGPTARVIEIMAKSYGIDYVMGIEEDETIPPTMKFFENYNKITQKEVTDMIESVKPEVEEVAQEVQEDAGEDKGFLSAKTGEM